MYLIKCCRVTRININKSNESPKSTICLAVEFQMNKIKEENRIYNIDKLTPVLLGVI